ncbi:MAG: hypothetical protein ACI9DK_000851 [Vicingaceae bacterium]|jgi:hypothetical protein
MYFKKRVEAEGLLVQGATIEKILEESQRLNIDLIIVRHDNLDFSQRFCRECLNEIYSQSKLLCL